MPIEGCHAKLITSHVMQFGVPSLSPDGSSMAFACGSFSDAYVCTIRVDGSGFRRLMKQANYLVNPQWSPSSDLIAIVRKTGTGEYGPEALDIYLIDPEGQIRSQVTHDPTFTGDAISEIQWSPDGMQIAFSTSGGIGNEKADIYVVNADGTGLQRLTYPPAFHWSPRWSPDGKRLAFLARSDEVTYLEIEALAGQGSPREQVALDIYGDLAWSPDGEILIYVAKRTDNYDLYLYDLISGEEIRLTADVAIDLEPRLSNDGSRILFRSDRSGVFEIYTMNRDGTSLIRQAINNTDDSIIEPFWSADGKGVFFFQSDHLDNTYYLWSVELRGACK